MHKRRIITGLLLLILSAGSLTALKIRIHSSLESDVIRAGGLLTNRIKVQVSGEDLGQSLSCIYPADPGYYGMELEDSSYSEKTFFGKTGPDEKHFFITYIMKPNFTGIVVLDPVLLGIVDAGVTNGVKSEKLRVEITKKDASPWWLYIIISLGLILAGYLVYIFLRNKRQSLEERTEQNAE